jgi:hypothetical protein
MPFQKRGYEMSNLLPKNIQTLVDAAFEEMQADPGHHLSHHRRRVIYDAIKSELGDEARIVQGWLAVIAAERVLPMFEALFPDDNLPRELLDTATGILRGQVDDERIEEMQDLGYHASGNCWGYDEDEMPWNVEMAAMSAYRAMIEALGHEPFQNLDKVVILGEVDLGSGTLNEHPEPIKGEQFTDEELCTDGNSDTAAPAAVASSCGADGPWCDPGKLHAFWEWWLKEAIPDAWERVHQEQAS